jgi:hypothetical protein
LAGLFLRSFPFGLSSRPLAAALAEASLCDPSTFVTGKGYRRHIDLWSDMIALCRRRERRRPRTYRSPCQPSVKTADDPVISLKSEPEEKRNGPLKCEGFQCLFCLSSNLFLEDKQHVYASKNSSDILIGAASINSNRTKTYLVRMMLRVIKLFWKARCISKTMQRACIISFYKPTASGFGRELRRVWM